MYGLLIPLGEECILLEMVDGTNELPHAFYLEDSQGLFY